jgi:hypothetical protein
MLNLENLLSFYENSQCEQEYFSGFSEDLFDNNGFNTGFKEFESGILHFFNKF